MATKHKRNTRDERRTFLHGVIRQIKRSRKPVTILFTDVEGSTSYWDRHGDIKGRLMIDQHNRVVFPVIRRFKGRIIKTIGDAVMASFRDPEYAMKAAIAIQQGLEQKRNEDRTFRMHVRIGIHTGQAIVERKDVYGDAVNVASRIESRGKGDDILVSHGTANRINKAAYHLKKKGSFNLKGKKNPLTIYQCKWQDSAKYVDSVQFSSFLPFVAQQKAELLIHTAVTIGLLYLLYIHYARYVLADSERLSLLTLDPATLLNIHPIAPVVLILLVSVAIQFFGSIHTIPGWAVRLVKGGFGFTIGFAAAYLIAMSVGGITGLEPKRVIMRSDHLFVEVLNDDTMVYSRPDPASKKVRHTDKGKLLLLADVKRSKGITWNKVFLGSHRYGWVQRVLPPAIGVPEKRLTVAYKFYFRYQDLFALVGGLTGFFWGFFNFRVRPV
jgi:class 3 adenylate cyclase